VVVKLSPSTKGAIAEMKASMWLMERGYEVFRNVTPDGPVDLVALDMESGQSILIDVKMARVSLPPSKMAGAVVRVSSKTRDGRPVSYDVTRQTDMPFFEYDRLTERQKALGVRLLLVLDDYIGFEEDHPAKMLDGFVKAHYQAKKEAKSSDNSTILLDQEHSVVS
jgi:hypothetical protein